MNRTGTVGRALAAYGWQPPATVPLALLAVVEALHSGAPTPTILLLVGLAATVPLAFSRAYPLPVALTVTVAAAMASVLYTRPAVSGVVAVLLAWFALLYGRLAEARAEATARDEARREMERSMVEYTALGERARIARELHDVVAHHISMISVQAETARLTTPGMPPEGASRLLAIGETARTALTEMRRLLGVLREDTDEEPDRTPQPGLHQLLDLVDENRAAGGGRTRLIVSGRLAPLGAGVELAAYRVVQESLTNARKHAPGAAVDVEIDYAPELLRLRVRDNGPGPRPGAGPAGHGLLGMRERVGTVGGQLRTGAAPAGGFMVEASIPVGDA
ncbi:sensor histidine kinase [Phytomonospora endophytica]|uniref:histidine kinase n=1 Tax=Phytomonospora endophytica TaxID=714109 RepID=A0A841FQK6_9ACTN|nr:sensor histidine kinase [Phytomonospora endophytica]MBB6035537.1 signal transduction histidine kinase [Phytomonospora endophytica]